MSRILRHPYTNALCISIYSCFYAAVFFITAANDGMRLSMLQEPVPDGSFISYFGAFLAAGGEAYVAAALLVLTAVVVALILSGRRSYDEYQAAMLTSCLVVSLALTLAAIACFYLAILCEPEYAAVKFTLFIMINWAVVVCADLVYVLLCRRG